MKIAEKIISKTINEAKEQRFIIIPSKKQALKLNKADTKEYELLEGLVGLMGGTYSTKSEEELESVGYKIVKKISCTAKTGVGSKILDLQFV